MCADEKRKKDQKAKGEGVKVRREGRALEFSIGQGDVVL